MGKYVIAGNWKMNKTPDEAAALIEAIKPLVKDAQCEVIVGVPFVDLPAALEAVKGSAIGVAAQNCHWEKSGAFTGEISAEMLKAMQVGTVILGHSERRTYFGDTDVTVAKRVRAALDAGLRVGEGSGAVAALPLLDMALAVYHGGQTFGRLGIDAYTPQ